jgi:hypothetical protein
MLSASSAAGRDTDPEPRAPHPIAATFLDSPFVNRLRPLLVSAGFASLLTGCTYHLAEIQEPGRAVAFTTTGPWRSMVYAARTESGVMVVVDRGSPAATSPATRAGAAIGLGEVRRAVQ